MHAKLRVKLLLLLLCLQSAASTSEALKFRAVEMPSLVQRGANFWLSCQFELESGARRGQADDNEHQEQEEEEQLYSVKWYKNNEEFYRLISVMNNNNNNNATSGPPASASNPANHSAIISTHTGQLMQQQYFSQVGLNVMMSASNATHVRLLNSSLQSEGVYGCEISSQTLATIKQEKEIKVYVLPAANRPVQVMGLKSKYSLGEPVELNCLSDFSRPAPALGWFLNEHRIQASSKWFQLEPSTTTSKSNLETNSNSLLSRSSLVLKFKLTSELLAMSLWSPSLSAAGAGNEPANGHSLESGGGGNQSWSSSSSSSVAGRQLNKLASYLRKVKLSSAEQTSKLVDLLKLECKYKLTEVSDVTFNELLVSSSSAGRPPIRTDEAPRRAGRQLAAKRGPVPAGRLIRTPDNQIVQLGGGPVALESLRARPATCSSTNAVQLDDPLIVQLAEHQTGSTSDELLLLGEEEASEQEGGAQPRPPKWTTLANQIEASLGSTLSVNCSTLGALLATQPAPLDATSSGATGHQSHYCGDWWARRKSLISGKYQLEESNNRSSFGARHLGGSGAGAAQTSNNNNNRRRPLVAYVGLPARLLSGPSGDAEVGAAAAADKQATSEQQINVAADSPQEEGGQELLAPPLLEWFVNHQEAPRSSASYSPELPLLAPAGRSGHRRQAARAANSRRPAGAQRQPMQPAAVDEDEDQPQVDLAPAEGDSGAGGRHLPSIDYREYFANFANLRPIEQQLGLTLSLDSRHFATSDSLLRLRCSSTQAQVLLADAVQVRLVGLAAGSVAPADQTGGAWTHGPQAHQRRINAAQGGPALAARHKSFSARSSSSSSAGAPAGGPSGQAKSTSASGRRQPKQPANGGSRSRLTCSTWPTACLAGLAVLLLL